jgi:hypothetical protein
MNSSWTYFGNSIPLPLKNDTMDLIDIMNNYLLRFPPYLIISMTLLYASMGFVLFPRTAYFLASIIFMVATRNTMYEYFSLENRYMTDADFLSVTLLLLSSIVLCIAAFSKSIRG